MFAAHSYIARQGRPETPQDLLCHDVIGYDRDDQIIEGFRNAGFPVTRDFFAIRSDDQVVCWQMVVAGFGIGFNQLHIGAREPRVERLDLTPLPSLPIWLVAHSELRHSARVRRVFDYLAETLREYADVPA
jgi:DNA-binding transcriptional LysR family regulator